MYHCLTFLEPAQKEEQISLTYIIERAQRYVELDCYVDSYLSLYRIAIEQIEYIMENNISYEITIDRMDDNCLKVSLYLPNASDAVLFKLTWG